MILIETHVCKLRGIRRSRVLRFFRGLKSDRCVTQRVYKYTVHGIIPEGVVAQKASRDPIHRPDVRAAHLMHV